MTSLGTAGGSLTDAGFAANAGTARAGKAGEILTARILDAQARTRGFTVLHDLRIPRAKANIDHVVVAGDRVWVIDSKLPYGRREFEYVEKGKRNGHLRSSNNILFRED